MRSKMQRVSLHTSKGLSRKYGYVPGMTLSSTPSGQKYLHQTKKTTKSVRNPRSSESDEDENYAIASRPKQRSIRKPSLKKYMPEPQKVFDAFHEAITKLEILGVFFSQIEKAERVADWMEVNDRSDKGHAKELLHHLRAMASILIEDEAASSPPSEQAFSNTTATDLYFTYRGPPKSLMLLAPMEIFQGLDRYSTKKVLGFARLKGQQYPAMCALPGWLPCAEPHPNLLDSKVWTEKVQKVAETYGYKFKVGSFDDWHKVPLGTTYSSHVEPKLMLYIACKELEDLKREKLHLGHLYKLRLITRLEVEIFVSEAPCKDCLKFKAMLEELTGIKFHIRLAPNLGHLRPKRDSGGRKCYGLVASDVSDESDGESEISQLGRPQARRPNIEIQIPATQHSQVRKGVRTSVHKNRTTIETTIISEAQNSRTRAFETPKKRSHDRAFTPPSSGTRSQVVVREMAPFPSRNSYRIASSARKKRPVRSFPSPGTPSQKRHQFQYLEEELEAELDELDEDELQIVGHRSTTDLGAKKIKFF